MPPPLEGTVIGLEPIVPARRHTRGVNMGWVMSRIVLKRPRLWNFKDCQQERAQRWILYTVNGASQSQHVTRINAVYACLCVFMCVYGEA